MLQFNNYLQHVRVKNL